MIPFLDEAPARRGPIKLAGSSLNCSRSDSVLSQFASICVHADYQQSTMSRDTTRRFPTKSIMTPRIGQDRSSRIDKKNCVTDSKIGANTRNFFVVPLSDSCCYVTELFHSRNCGMRSSEVHDRKDSVGLEKSNRFRQESVGAGRNHETVAELSRFAEWCDVLVEAESENRRNLGRLATCPPAAAVLLLLLSVMKRR